MITLRAHRVLPPSRGTLPPRAGGRARLPARGAGAGARASGCLGRSPHNEGLPSTILLANNTSADATLAWLDYEARSV